MRLNAAIERLASSSLSSKVAVKRIATLAAVLACLEAVRDTFGEKPTEGWPPNYAPEDVGLGPYPRADGPLK